MAVSVRFYTVVNVLRANCWEEGWTRGGERWCSGVGGKHSYYAALRKDCRGRLPFIRGKHGAADKLLLHVRSPLHRDWIDRDSRKIGKRRMGREEEGMRGEGKDRKKNDCRAEMMLNSYYVDYLQACELSRSVHPIFFDLLRRSIWYYRTHSRHVYTYNLRDITLSDINLFLRNILRQKFKYYIRICFVIGVVK